jgi:hypothetical protein
MVFARIQSTLANMTFFLILKIIIVVRVKWKLKNNKYNKIIKKNQILILNMFVINLYKYEFKIDLA